MATGTPPAELPHLLGCRRSLDPDSKDYTQSASPASPELQSIGSLGHDRGLCRPGGFMHHKGGCSAGLGCSFCHLCPPGTIEKQRTMKRQRVRATRCNRVRQSITGLATPTDGSATPPEHDDASQCRTNDTQSRSRADTPPPGADFKKAVLEATDVPSHEVFAPLRFVNLSSCPLGARSIAPPASRPLQLPHLLSRAAAQPPTSDHSDKAECTTSAGSYLCHALAPGHAKSKLQTKCQLRRPHVCVQLAHPPDG